jgi:peptidoglycan/xylan/chitin deacetylase (PgdA/CDA1 family)
VLLTGSVSPHGQGPLSCRGVYLRSMKRTLDVSSAKWRLSLGPGGCGCSVLRCHSGSPPQEAEEADPTEVDPTPHQRLWLRLRPPSILLASHDFLHRKGLACRTVDRVHAGAPPGRRPLRNRVLFTSSWDDGHPLDVRIADMLEEFGFVGTFYASTGPGGRRLIVDDDLARIGRNHEFGVHGQTHTIFTELPRSALAGEIQWAVEEMSRFGDVGRVVAPPRGKIDTATRVFIGELGFAVRTGAIIGSTEVSGNSLEPTFQLYPHRWSTIMRNCAYRRRIPIVALLLALARNGGSRDRFVALLRAAVRSRRYVHIWGHAADIERLDLWDALRRLLGTAADLRLVPVSNSEAFDHLSSRTSRSA